MLSGTIASKGLAYGKVHVIQTLPPVVTRTIPPAKIEIEIESFHNACQKVTEDIQALIKRSNLSAQTLQILEAHLMMIEDEELQQGIVEYIQTEEVNVEAAINIISRRFADTLAGLDDEYMRERASDILDVAERLIYRCMSIPMFNVATLSDPVILVANDLTPSQTIQLTKDKVLGFVTVLGGSTSHTAIIARTLEVPAIVGVASALQSLQHGSEVIVNALDNQIIIEPSQVQVAQFKQQQSKYLQEKEELNVWKNKHAQTLDGKTFTMSANINSPANLDTAAEYKAEGVGLFRSEMLFMQGAYLPSEEKQFLAYKNATEKLPDRNIVIRTLDIGGDKEVPSLSLPKEMNPFLGYRAIRICLKDTELFQTQLRAILRASAYGKIMIMFPMISFLEELLEAKKHLEIAKAYLRKNAQAFNEKIEVGVMIETPSSVMIAHDLIKHVDFFSIGANDLVQYTLAVDRTNEYVAHLSQPLAPSVIRMIDMTIKAAHEAGKWVSMCGEMAGQSREALLLAGLGLDEFSMNPVLIPSVRRVLSSYALKDLQALATRALACVTVKDVEAELDTFIRENGAVK